MDPVEALTQVGGVATTTILLRRTSRQRLRRAVRRGEVVRIAKGRYRLPDADKALLRAAELRGMVSHLSAAQVYGWEVPFPTSLPWVSVPRNRVVTAPRRANVVWADLSEESGFVTSELQTVVDCARRLPFGVALCVADSALRHDDVDHELLVRAAAQVRGKGAAQARRVARHASPLAANPFESVLRAIALDAGLDVLPQVEITVDGQTIHPDLVDRDRRIVLEADSWEFHSDKDAFKRDCWRYTALVVGGWTVLRFTWWQVMEDPDWVRACLLALLEGPARGADAA